MKHLTIILLLLFLLPSLGFSQMEEEDKVYGKHSKVLANGLECFGTATAYSEFVDIAKTDYHGVTIWVTGTGAVNLDVNYVYSHRSDQDYTILETSILSDAITITDNNPHRFTANLTYIPYLKFQVVGLAGNGADNKINIIFHHNNKLDARAR